MNLSLYADWKQPEKIILPTERCKLTWHRCLKFFISSITLHKWDLISLNNKVVYLNPTFYIITTKVMQLSFYFMYNLKKSTHTTHILVLGLYCLRNLPNVNHILLMFKNFVVLNLLLGLNELSLYFLSIVCMVKTNILNKNKLNQIKSIPFSLHSCQMDPSWATPSQSVPRLTP